MICIENGQFQFYPPSGHLFRTLKETDNLWRAATAKAEEALKEKVEALKENELLQSQIEDIGARCIISLVLIQELFSLK